MKRMKIKPPKPAPPPPCPGQLPLFDRVTTLILETDSDPDYERAKQIFSELLKEMN